jgi:hypothetical protein
MIINNRHRAAYGKCRWQQWIIVKAQARLNLGRQLVSQIHKPATGIGQINLRSILVLGRPPSIKRV